MPHQAEKSELFAVGVDYGTNNVRAVVVSTADGSEAGSCAFDYPSGEAGILLDAKDPNLARQNPADYIEGFYRVVGGAVRAARRRRGFRPENVAGIGIDTTGSTPLPVDRRGVPLAMLPEFRKDLAAHAWLWKDHTSFAEAAEITDLARRSGESYLSKCGGAYSSEWFWSKILRCCRTAPKVAAAADAWIELADFIPAHVTGASDPGTMAHGVCAAGHKAMYHPLWDGLPRREFLAQLDPSLPRIAARFALPAKTSDQPAGRLSREIAARVGLPPGTPVAVGLLDAHAGAVGAGIKPGTLVKIIGTSTCDMMVAPLEGEMPDIPGLCGIVPGSIIPGMFGLEAGQSAVGDIFHWFVRFLSIDGRAARGDAHAALTRAAGRLRPGESGLLALDWNNGNRCVLVDPLLTGLLVGQTLHTTAPEAYRALIEATAFGALTIINRLEQYGVAVREVVNCGGIAVKNPLVMQIYADVCNRPMKVCDAPQTCALGAAMFGATAGGAFKSVAAAQRKMACAKSRVHRPVKSAAKTYAELFALYGLLHDAFGLPGRRESLGRIMKDLIAIRNRARAEAR